MILVVDELADIDVSCTISFFALAVFHSVDPRSLVHATVLKCRLAESIKLIVYELTL